mgnify:CR=1 FL=1
MSFLVNCPDCSKRISSSASACPNCGCDLSGYIFTQEIRKSVYEEWDERMKDFGPLQRLKEVFGQETCEKYNNSFQKLYAEYKDDIN